jgi:hypothetical protein
VQERRIQSEAGRRRRALFDLLHTLERPRATGVLRLFVDQAEVGSVVACEGRICFATVDVEEPRPEHASGSDAPARVRLSQIAAEARQAGATFCGTLLSQPLDAVDRLRAELRLQTVVALRTLAECAVHFAVAREMERARGDYAAQLTFAAVDLYAAALHLDEPPQRDPVMDVFDGFRLSGDTGVLLAREPGYESMPYPIASYGLPGATLQDLLSLCRCAGELMRPASFLGGMVEPTYAVLRADEGRHWVCVGQGRHLALIERHEGADLAPVIAQALRPH